MNDLSIYENAKHWIAQYESVDELKDYRDKAAAVEEYGRRANDFELEVNAGRARVRAERRCGELLKKIEKAKGGRPSDKTDSAVESVSTLKDMGLNGKQSMKYQQLANVPEDEFEAAISVPGSIPSAHGLLKSRKQEKQKRIDEDALYLWGRLNDFERKLFGRALDELLDEMSPAMRQDADRILPLIRNWLR